MFPVARFSAWEQCPSQSLVALWRRTRCFPSSGNRKCANGNSQAEQRKNTQSCFKRPSATTPVSRVKLIWLFHFSSWNREWMLFRRWWHRSENIEELVSIHHWNIEILKWRLEFNQISAAGHVKRDRNIMYTCKYGLHTHVHTYMYLSRNYKEYIQLNILHAHVIM